MKRGLVFVLIPLFFSMSAHADDSIVLWGNYYKERSTRVIEPTILVNKDLPYDAKLEVGYLVDQVTSASGAFTATDRAFTEYRHDVRVAASMKFLGMITPGLMFRVSHEGDYDSVTLGGSTELTFDRDNSIVRGTFQMQFDDARRRDGDNTVDLGNLRTYFLGLSGSQVLSKNLIVGGSLELRLLRGFQENGYRPENHPRERKRHSATAWAAYHLEDSDTTIRGSYRFYSDNWHLKAHTFDVELTQRVVQAFDVFGRFRYYTQGQVYFTQPIGEYTTTDPKLFPFDTRFYEFGFRWTMSALEGTALDAFAKSRIEPSYGFLDQPNRYGSAHLVQIGWFWPF